MAKHPKNLDVAGKVMAFGIMKKKVPILIAACLCVAGLGSVVALAQTAPNANTTANPSTIFQADPFEVTPPPAPTRAETTRIEDAPVDLPANPPSDWSPGMTADPLPEPARSPILPRVNQKPSKSLSDLGVQPSEGTPSGGSAWDEAGGRQAAQAQLLARASRRERAVDPMKRADLSKLSRVMGSLHALRVSCAGRDDQTYRSRMATLLDLEAPDGGELRGPLVDAFNGGFQAYGRGTGTCPTDARTQEAGLAKNGFALARAMSARYRPIAKAQTDSELPPATEPRKNAPSAVQSDQPGRAAWNTMTAN